MKRSWVLAGTFVVTLLLAVFFLLSRERSAQPDRQFRVQDTDRIRRIVLQQDTVRVVLRERKGVWRVNGRWKARGRAVKVLKKVLAGIRVKSPVSGDLPEHIRGDTASRHTAVEVYGSLLPLKRFDIYLTPLLPGGNMMRLRGREEWYITYLPGEEVNPAALFVADPWYWRDLTLFRYLLGEVTSVEIRYGEDDKKGFSVTVDTLTGEVRFVPHDPALRGLPVDTARIKTFLTYFQQLSCDAYDRSYGEVQRDSLLRTKALYEVRVTATRGRRFRMLVYPLPARDTSRAYGMSDANVARAWVEPQQEMVLIKYYRIDPFLAEAGDFLPETGSRTPSGTVPERRKNGGK